MVDGGVVKEVVLTWDQVIDAGDGTVVGLLKDL